jgi:DNA-binding NarL/FixJ family response regulator
MAILIISSNPLLVESLSESLSKSLKTALDSAAPEEALQRIQQTHPQILLVDEAIPPGLLRKIIKQARRQNKTHFILLDCSSNDFIFLDSYQATFDSVEQLVRSIQMKELENENEVPGNHKPEADS